MWKLNKKPKETVQSKECKEHTPLPDTALYNSISFVFTVVSVVFLVTTIVYEIDNAPPPPKTPEKVFLEKYDYIPVGYGGVCPYNTLKLNDTVCMKLKTT